MAPGPGQRLPGVPGAGAPGCSQWLWSGCAACCSHLHSDPDGNPCSTDRNAVATHGHSAAGHTCATDGDRYSTNIRSGHGLPDSAKRR